MPNRNVLRRHLYLLLAIPVILSLMISEYVFHADHNLEKENIRITALVDENLKRVDQLMGEVADRLTKEKKNVVDWDLLDIFQGVPEELSVTVSSSNSLLFWSSNLVSFPNDIMLQTDHYHLAHLPTGWFLQKSIRVQGYTVNGFLLIKREFLYKNRYIHSSFNSEFSLADDYRIEQNWSSTEMNILSSEGKYLFTISNDLLKVEKSERGNLNSILLLIILMLLFAQLNTWTRYRFRSHSWFRLIFVNALAVAISSGVMLLKWPHAVFETPLFSPADFAYSSWLPSLGGYMILSILLFHFAHSFFLFFDTDEEKIRSASLGKLFIFIIISVYFCSLVFFLQILLQNSNINLEFISDLAFSSSNIFAFIAVALQLLGFIMILLRARFLYRRASYLTFNRDYLFAGIGSFAILWFSGIQNVWLPLSYFMILGFVVSALKPLLIKDYSFSFLLIMSILAAIYVNSYAHFLIEQKQHKELDLWAIKLGAERDPGAESFLSQLDSRLNADTIIKYHLVPPYKSLEAYFQNNYFTGFWRNYNLQLTVCTPADSVFLTNENRRYPCLSFFNSMIESKGMKVSGSNFYFMDRLNGRISYLGKLDLLNADNQPVKAFIELTSRVIPEGKGYPELLLDESASRENRDGGYSYAKYFNGELVDRGGEYNYAMKFPSEFRLSQEFTHFVRDGYVHSIYRRNSENFVVVSYPELTFSQQISTFPYLFLLFILLGFLLVSLDQKYFRLKRRALDFREKIQMTLIASLLVILTVIGIGLMIYNSNKLLDSMQESLNEKLRSVSSELSIRIGEEAELDAPMRDYLNDQLIILSDIIRADINLYDLKGRLFATSRSEIFDRGLLSRRINPVAFRQIAVRNATLFLHKENLGRLKFFSAYVPVYNASNKLVGYLNLPYFTKQDEFKKQISGFIVAFSNLYIFLILFSLLVALLISRKLTAPLLKIENYLRGIQLGKANEKIDYVGDDEIGRLAMEYNRKVDELAESAKMLAKSERESAWKEMARQIAHEINNPLTPMKLSIQYLQRLKQQNPENFTGYFDRVSKSLIEQIDALSIIASSFSDFAKISKSVDEPVDLQECVRDVLLLFENNNATQISFSSSLNGKSLVIADKNQLRRAFINLVKNGLQAIPEDREGHLEVKLSRQNEKLLVQISDNGTGVPVSLQEKLFEPNFTTKTGGMGLGLAITRRIVENSSGNIWFQSNETEGTDFFVEFPEYNPAN